jgi:hypothetical protein
LAVADEACTWVADRIFWIGGTVFVALALAVAASMWLQAWTDRREARFAAAHGILSRADVILPQRVRAVAAAAEIGKAIADLPPSAGRPAIEQHVHFHFDPADREAARIIRTALSRPSGDAITEGNDVDSSSRRNGQAQPAKPGWRGGHADGRPRLNHPR